MNIPRIAHIIGHIDDDLIEGADEEEKKKGRGSKVKSIRTAIIALAACVALTFTGLNILSRSIRSKFSKVAETLDRDDGQPHEESAKVRKYPEKNGTAVIDGVTYKGTGEKLVDFTENGTKEELGTYTITGYDDETNELYETEAVFFTIEGFSKDEYVAGLIDDLFYVYRRA